MKKLSKYIIRKSDGEIYYLNDNGLTYSNMFMRDNFPNSLRDSWTYECLMEDHSGYFIALDDLKI